MVTPVHALHAEQSQEGMQESLPKSLNVYSDGVVKFRFQLQLSPTQLFVLRLQLDLMDSQLLNQAFDVIRWCALWDKTADVHFQDLSLAVRTSDSRQASESSISPVMWSCTVSTTFLK